MGNRIRYPVLLALTGIFLLAAGPIRAQQGGNLDEISRLVEGAMPSAITDDNTELVNNLMGAQLGDPLSKTFDYNRVRAALFGRTAPSLEPDCLRKFTPNGEADPGDCIATAGSEGGAGAHKVLRFSKNMGLGNVRFQSRPPAPKDDEETDPQALAVKLSDQDAYAAGVKFLNETLGVPMEEMALPPAGVPLPVKSLAIGGGDEQGQRLPAVFVQKVLIVRRGLKLPKPIPIMDPKTQQVFELSMVPAPGEAWVALGDPSPNDPDPATRMGLRGAMVADWQELRPNPNLTKAKTRSQLVQEVAERLRTASETTPSLIKILIGLSSESKGTFSTMLPAIQVFAASAERDPTEEEQQKVAGKPTAGQVFFVPLVEVGEQSER